MAIVERVVLFSSAQTYGLSTVGSAVGAVDIARPR